MKSFPPNTVFLSDDDQDIDNEADSSQEIPTHHHSLSGLVNNSVAGQDQQVGGFSGKNESTAVSTAIKSPKRIKLRKRASSLTLSRLIERLPSKERSFYTMLDEELETISAFYKEKEDEAVKKFKSLQRQLEYIKSIECKNAKINSNKKVIIFTVYYV